MPTNMTQRQAVLAKIWESQGPQDLWKLMIQESSARATDIAPELLREADACRHVNTNLAGKLEEMAEEVSRVQTCVQQFATAKTIADLLGAYQTYEFAYSDKFHLILGGF